VCVCPYSSCILTGLDSSDDSSAFQLCPARKKCKWAKWEFTLFMMMIHREHQPTESIMHKSWFWLTRSTFKFLDIYFILFYFSVSFFFFLLNFNTVTEMSCKCRMAADTRGSHFPHSASVDWLPLSYY
jgi:hypothetical protein